MIRIITLANQVIDACVKCELRPVCSWFEGASQVILDDLTSDQYAQLTQEQIASRIHANVGSPEEDCDQISFDDMMEKVDEITASATMPDTTKDLLAFFRKISQLRRRLSRIPIECRDPFDAPIRAIIDRALAALDYHFLTIGLDILDFIHDDNSGYDRQRLLRRDNIDSVIHVLTARAHKLTAEEVVAYKGSFKDYKPQKPDADKSPQPKETKKSSLPDNLLTAKPYLDALQKAGYLDRNYRWTHKEGTTNYHAGWASKIIVHNCPGVTHQCLSQLIGVSSLSSYVTLAKTKTTIVQQIANLFVADGLSATAE